MKIADIEWKIRVMKSHDASSAGMEHYRIMVFKWNRKKCFAITIMLIEYVIKCT